MEDRFENVITQVGENAIENNSYEKNICKKK